MRTDIDYIISLMKEYTIKSDVELDEQETAPADSGSGKPNTAGEKWSSGAVRGPANMLGLKGEKWSSGVARGPGNPVP